jgi:O-antigen ligase
LLVAPLPSLNAGTFVFNIPTAESAYVAALVETGIVGFAALMLFILVVLARAYRNAQSARAIGIAAATVAIFCGSLTVVGLTTDQNGMLLGVLIGLIFCDCSGCHSERSEESRTGVERRFAPLSVTNRAERLPND